MWQKFGISPFSAFRSFVNSFLPPFRHARTQTENKAYSTLKQCPHRTQNYQ